MFICCFLLLCNILYNSAIHFLCICLGLPLPPESDLEKSAFSVAKVQLFFKIAKQMKKKMYFFALPADIV